MQKESLRIELSPFTGALLSGKTIEDISSLLRGSENRSHSLDSDVFYKARTNTTIIHTLSTKYKLKLSYTFEEEYATVCQLYCLAPQNIPQPLGRVFGNNKLMGYLSQNIDGVSLKDCIKNKQADYKFALRLEAAIIYLHSNDLVHGDLHSENVLVKNLTPFLIDPIGINIDSPDFQQAMLSDKYFIEKTKVKFGINT